MKKTGLLYGKRTIPLFFLLEVPGNPVVKARPRVYKGHGITPKKTLDAEKRIRDIFIAEHPGIIEPTTKPVNMKITCYMADRKVRDWDNLAKLVCDALNGVAFADDSQIRRCVVDKILPSKYVQGKRGLRKRKGSDPLTSEVTGEPYEPHTEIVIYERVDIHDEALLDEV